MNENRALRRKLRFQGILSGVALLVAGWSVASVAAEKSMAVPEVAPIKSIRSMAVEFASPAAEYHPWVYWFWNNGNLTREGITADLEAMQRVGIRGVLIMEVGQGAPRGPVDFLSGEWRELFSFMLAEAQRLGIEVNMNNDAGWNGSGGAWIQPDEAMQVLAWTETTVAAGSVEKPHLAEPAKRQDYYRDVAVLAFPAPAADAVKRPINVDSNRRESPKSGETWPEATVAKEAILDLTDRLGEDGSLNWLPPTGDGAVANWMVLRVGHTCKGIMVAPAPEGGVGLECDKLSVKGTDAAFNGQIGRLCDENGKFIGDGRVFASTHIDSWENGSQNWTALMREEFQKRRGYDVCEYLPVFAGYVVDSADQTDRFLWDFRRTVSEMVMDNHVRRMRDLANEHGLRLSIEAYGSPCDYVEYGGIADEPMGEFWIGGGAMESCRGMASAGHVYGKRIIGAETFTAGGGERWLEHPGSIKALGDQAMAEGINRFVFHRYSFQPWMNVKPGLMMGPWGTHYERTQTWWEQTPAWHAYLARCHYMLRQGDYVADICYVEPEDSPQGFSDHLRAGYAWDTCGTDAVLKMRVEYGLLALPSGMKYRVLALPESDRMTNELFHKVIELLADGATVIGRLPAESYGLVKSVASDDVVRKQFATDFQLKEQSGAKEWHIGAGTLVWGKTADAVLGERSIPADLTTNERLNWIHRRVTTNGWEGTADIYFVANPESWPVSATVTFRATGRPELWMPETGDVLAAPAWKRNGETTTVLLPLRATESVFVVFANGPAADGAENTEAIEAIARDGKTLFDPDQQNIHINVLRANYGVAGDAGEMRDATEAVRAMIAAGRTEISVPSVLAAVGDPKYGTVKTLSIDYEMDGIVGSVSATDGGVVRLVGPVPPTRVVKATYGPAGDAARTVDVAELIQKMVDAGELRFPVTDIASRRGDPAHLVVKTLTITYERDGLNYTWTGEDGRMVDLRFASGAIIPFRLPEGVVLAAPGIRDSGEYVFRFADGRQFTQNVTVPAPMSINGPWSVAFPAKELAMEKLTSWSESDDPDVRHFSGTATYRTTFTVPAEMLVAVKAGNARILLDPGRVGVIAEVSLNRSSPRTLWMSDPVMDVTESLLVGENRLEIRVTNLWVNRLIGDAALPDCPERRADGMLSAWPEWLLKGEPDPTGRQTFCMWNLWSKDEPLVASGLLGPVRLECVVFPKPGK